MTKIARLPNQLVNRVREFAWRQRLQAVGRDSDIRRGAHFEYARHIQLGSGCCIGRHAILRANTDEPPGIRVGDRTHVGEFTLIAANRGRVLIGSDSWLGPHCAVHGNGGVTVGDNVMIASHCAINTVSHHSDRRDIPMSRQGIYCDPVVIEDDVWIGVGAIILQGVRIGRGSIVAAGALVNRDLPPGTVAMGVPARMKINRFATAARQQPVAMANGSC
jgi:acetyltransferase-like isoleucine patch superfamily enzyme